MATDTIPEEWRIVADFPDYEVSSHGRVRRKTDDVRTHRSGTMWIRYSRRSQAAFSFSGVPWSVNGIHTSHASISIEANSP